MNQFAEISSWQANDAFSTFEMASGLSPIQVRQTHELTDDCKGFNQPRQ